MNIQRARHILKIGNSEILDSKELKKRYRKLAKENHPDIGGSADKFREITEAYEYLSVNRHIEREVRNGKGIVTLEIKSLIDLYNSKTLDVIERTEYSERTVTIDRGYLYKNDNIFIKVECSVETSEGKEFYMETHKFNRDKKYDITMEVEDSGSGYRVTVYGKVVDVSSFKKVIIIPIKIENDIVIKVRLIKKTKKEE